MIHTTLPEDSVVVVDSRDVSDFDPCSVVAFLTVKTEKRKFEKYKMFERFRNVQLEDPCIRWKKRGEIAEITCEKPAFGVHIKSENDNNEKDNFFFLKPGDTKRLKLKDGVIESVYDYLERIKNV